MRELPLPRHAFRGLVSLILSFVLAALTLPLTAQGALAANNDAELGIEAYVTGHQGEVPSVGPGESFSYTVNLQCSAAKCTEAAVTATLPSPLVYDGDSPITVSPAIADATVSGQALTIAFRNGGLDAGTVVMITVKAKLPKSASADNNGDSAKMTFTATADNADTVTDAASVTLDIPPHLAASATKSVKPATTQPAISGREVTFTIGGANTSNISVGSIQISDPADVTGTNAFDQLALTGITTLTPPTGADRVAFSWWDGSSWRGGSAGVIPADPADLLAQVTDSGASLTDVRGVRFAFTKEGGTLPVGEPAEIVLATTARNGAFDSLADGESMTVVNKATATVSRSGETASDTAQASVTFKRQSVHIDVTKSFDDATLVAGKQTTVTVQARTGVMPTSSITIAEPAVGTPNLADQGLTFGDFVTDSNADAQLTWPDGATAASITYAYTDGTSERLTTTQLHTLPAPTKVSPTNAVAEFSVTFTADDDGISPDATAILPFTVTAHKVSEEAGTAVTNTIGATATGQTGSDSATGSDDLTLLPQRVRTSVSKTFNRSSIWSSAGSSATVQLTAKVASDSTVGSDHLTVSDDDGTFWDSFDIRRILPTDVPSNAVLTVEYDDGTGWHQLTAPVTGAADGWTYTLTTAQRAAARGIRFVFTPKTDGTLLPAGFTVVPRLDVALRPTLRSDPDVPATGSAEELTDAATSEVANPAAIVSPVSDQDSATIALKPIGGGGSGGVDLVEKYWLDADKGVRDDNPSVSALSDQQRTAVVSWGTDGLSMSSVQLVDDPHVSPITGSLYDAFNLVRVRPITTATDALIAQDKVSRVELYVAGTGWTDVTAQACPSASACDGTFPGYDLTAAQQQSTLAVRLTFEAGSRTTTGTVATSGDTWDRHVRLDYQLRRTLRSDTSAYVLGTSHGHTYNSGERGIVNNNAQATGTLTDGSGTVQSQDAAGITIYDRPLNVSFTKSLDQTALGIPQHAGDTFPLVSATLKATNNTASGVPEIDIADPSSSTSGLAWYRYLNLYQIELTTLPDGLSTSDVSVVLTSLNGGSTTTQTMTADEARAMTPAQLTHIVGVRVVYGNENNLSDSTRALIPSDASATVVLTYQLRSSLRNDDGSDGTPMTETPDVVNTAQGSVVSPGGIGCAYVADGDPCDAPTATDSGQVDIADPTYSVSASKWISPASRYEDESNSYTVTLTGRPTGTARTQLLTLTDDAPTFWNAFTFASVPTLTLPAPVNQLRMSVLTGVDYSLVGGTLVATCSGNTDLTACWHASAWQDADADRHVTPTLPGGIVAADVRGVQFQARRLDGGTTLQWERPADPMVTVRFSATRRTLLVYGTNGATDTPVPSTLPGMATAPGEQVQGMTSDAVQVDGVAAWRTQSGNAYAGTDQATASTLLKHRVNQIRVEKTPGQGTDGEAPRYDLDGTIPYKVTITNTGAWAASGLRIDDRISLVDGSSPLVPASVDPVFSFTVDGSPVPGFAANLDTATGVISVTVPAGFVLNAGQVLVFASNLRFRDRLPAGTTVTNTVSVGSGRDFEKCEASQNAQTPAPAESVADCVSATTVVAAASTPLTVAKAVKGSGAGDPAAAAGEAHHDDLGVIAVGATDASACQDPDADGFYSSPCTPITRPGGKETWRLSLSNNGNVAANMISAIDVLPAPGDTGVIVNTARKSRFTPTFLGNIHVTGLDSAPAHTLSFFYSTTSPGTTCNKADILNDTKPGGQSNCAITWIPFDNGTDADALATAKAIKVLVTFTHPAQGLAPGVPFTVTFDTRTPAFSPVADAATVEPVAWNSVAVGSRTADSASFPARASLVTEPAKVGVAIAGGELALAKTVSAPTADWTQWLPSAYAVTVSCSSLGSPVPLRNSSGTDVSKVQLAADGTVNSYNGTHLVNLPLFSTCQLEELPGQGASPSFQPASAVALRDYSSVANIAHGWSSGAATASLGVTNTYSAAGFTVSKTVPEWPAKYADGTPVVFKDFTYSASCTFLDHEVVPEADRNFSLRDGGSKTFTNLPTGADCTVTETFAAGASSTSVTTRQTAVQVDSGTTSTSFTLVAGDETATTVSYINNYTEGSAVITKDFTGAGADAWGDQDFQVQLVCTHPDAQPGEVYRATRTLSKSAGLTWTVDHLATGAQCVVTETATGGATSTTIAGGTFTVDDAQPAAVTVTNRFATGSVTVTKSVKANGAATTASPWADGTFPVTLTCTRPVNGTDIAVAVPGSATKSLTKSGGWSVTWTGLPTNATCSASEDVAAITGVTGQPDPSVTVSPASVTVSDSGTSTIRVVNNYRAGKLKITKTLLGAGAAFFSGATFSVSCTLGGTAIFSQSGIAVPTGSLTSAEIGPIPFGSDCTVAETSTGGADSTPAPQVVTVNQNAATDDLTTVGFTNRFSAGTLTITKALAGEAAAETWATGGTFVVAVSCGTTSTASFTQNVTLVGAASTTLMNGASPRLFPVGTHCWAAETTTGGATSSSVSAPDFASGVVVAVQSDPTVAQTLGITATNSYSYAGLTVTKIVAGTNLAKDQDGNNLSYPGSVGFTARCTFNNYTTTLTPLNTSFTITGSGDGTWGSKTFDKLPSGASCTITETTPAMSPTVTYSVTRTGQSTTSGSGTSKAFTLVAGGITDNVASFTNTFSVGSLRITKVVSPSGSVWASAPFTVTVLCTVAYPSAGTVAYSKSYTFSTSAASYVVATIANLPTGASCTTTETKAGGATTTGYTNQTGSITKAGTLATTVTNTFNTGSVTISKALKVNGVTTSAEPWASAAYTMTLTCSRLVNGTTETLDLTRIAAGSTQVLNKANGYAYTWTGLPTGATCTAAETSIDYPVDTPAQPAPTVTYSPTQAVGVTVGNGTTVSQMVTNDFAFGSVQIAKTLAGDAADTFGTGTFTYSVSCTLDGTAGTVFSRTGITLSQATSLTSAAIGPIPKGAVCTVTETGTGGATSVSPTGGRVVLDAIEAGGTRSAAFTNTFDYAGFTVTKAVDNGGAKHEDGATDVVYAATYHFSATCTLDGRTVLNVADFTLLDGGSRAFSNLPVGASCSVIETNTGNAHASSVITQNGTSGSTTDGSTSASFSLVSGQSPLAGTSPAATVVAFTDAYTVGGLDITKSVTGAGAAAWGSGPFTVRLVCTLNHDADSSTAEVTVFDATHSLTGGATWAVRKLPTAAHCAVSETRTAGANTTTIDVPTPTITATTQTVTVTNTFNTGSVRVTKAIANGLGTLAPWKSATYELTLACTKDFDGDGTAESFTVPNAVKTVTGPGSATWTGLPQGATCSATETAITYPAGTPAQPAASVGASSAVTVGNSTTVTQTLTNTFSTAKVKIAKTIAGTGATTWGTGPFVFSVSCTLTGSGTVFGPTSVTLTPTSGQTSLASADLGPIPHGSTCVATETDAAGAVPTDPANGTVTLTSVPAGSTTTASFTNTFDLAGFTVSKSVDSAAVDADGRPIAYDAAGFTASCLFRGSEVLSSAADRSFTLVAGASRSFTGLPTGASCTVRETGTSGAASTNVTVTQGTSSATAATTAAFTLVPGGASATTVAFTNHYTVGSLEVTKTVNGPGASLWGAGPFEVAVTCTLAVANPDQVFTDVAELSPTDPVWTIHNLPTGARCQVSEPKSGGANTTTITDAGVATVGNGTTAAVGVTNTFTLGAVSVTKKLTVDGTATTDVPWTQGSYTVTLSCSRDLDSDGTAEAIMIPHGPSRTITGAGSATFTDLPTGATCTVAETASSPVAQSTTISPSGSVTVGAVPSSPQEFTVTNNFGTSTLSVLKQLEGAGQATFGDGPFRFTLTCTLAGATDPVYSKTVTLSRVPGSPTTSLREDGLGPIPIGAECTVAETDRGAADATPAPVILTVAVDASANVATFTNQFSAGTIWLSKTLAGAAKDEDWATGATFGVLVTCQAEVDGVRGTVFSREVSITGGARLNVTDADGAASRVPLGSHCWIASETDSQGATSTTVGQHDWDTAAVVTAGSPASLQALELGLTNSYEYAGFTITKAVDNGGATDEDGDPITYPADFGFHATCTFNGATVLDRTVTVRDGSSQAFDHLPSGASCTTTETGTGHAAATSVRLTQAGTAQDEQQAGSATFTLVRAGDQPAEPSVTTVGFTNHFTTGAVTITKSVTGDGATSWGDQRFTVALRCTLDTDTDKSTPDAVVFEASRHLSAATSMSWTVGALATGAACEVSETATGGANATTITNSSFTVGDDPSTPAAVGIANEYTLGSVRVGKQIQVDGTDSDAEPYASAEYQVKLACRMLVNGTWNAIDIPGDGHGVGDDLDGVRTVIGSGSTTYSGLPTGASCDVSEAGAGFDLPAEQVSIDHPSLTVGDGTTVRAQVTNNYRTGTLQIAKQLQGEGVPDWSDSDFVFSVSCLLPDSGGVEHPVFSRTGIVLNQTDGLTSSLMPGIPVGAACTVNETRSGGADVPATPVSVTIVDGQENLATPTNEFNLGSLRVNLGLTLDGVPTTADPFVGGRYAVEVTCTRQVNGATVTAPVPGGGVWTFTGPGSHVFTDLPVGADCSVSQTSASLAPQEVSYDPSGSGSTSSGTVRIASDPDAPRTLGVVDHFLTGTLVITKQVLGAADNAVYPFTFTVSCTLAEDGVETPHPVFSTTVELSVAAGLTSDPVGPIPVGSDCVVVETATGGSTVGAEPAEVTISGTGENAVTMSNTFEAGSVVVTKAITVDGRPSTAEPYASGTYTVELTCSTQVDGQTVDVAVSGGATRTITGAGSVTYTGLPVGADCSAAETGSSLAIPDDQVSVSPGTVTVGEDPVGITVTNDFRTGSLVLNWQVAGVGAQFAGPATFTVDCTLAGATGSVFREEVSLDPSGQQTRVLSATEAASVTFSPIPIGAECSVTQTGAQGADRLAGIVSATGKVDLEAQVVNHYSAGTLTITKKLAGAGAQAHSGTTFGFTATCLAADGTTNFSGHVSVVGAGSVTVEDADGNPVLFPAGTRCWAEETDTGGADGHTLDHGGEATGVVVSADEPDTVQQLVVAAVNTFGAEDLAYTGFAGAGLAALGIVFVAAGAWLVRRRRA